MFSDLNPLGLETAILEIIIMLLGAFLIGFFTAWMIQQARRKSKKNGEDEPGLAAARNKNKELKQKLEQQDSSIKDLQARKTAAEKSASELSAEVKRLTQQSDKKATVSGQSSSPNPVTDGKTGTSDWEKEKATLKDKVKNMEKTISDNRSELGRMAAFRNEIKDLKQELVTTQAELASTKLAARAAENSPTADGDDIKSAESLKANPTAQENQELDSPVSNPELDKLNQEVVRMRASMATQEAGARRAEHRSKQLEKENKMATKERDQALEQLDDLQFKMDELQRQVGSMRTTTSKMDMDRPGGGTADFQPLTSLKGLGNRSAEFLEKLGINTMGRLAETDANTIQHIAKNLEKPVDVIQGWVDKAKERIS